MPGRSKMKAAPFGEHQARKQEAQRHDIIEGNEQPAVVLGVGLGQGHDLRGECIITYVISSGSGNHALPAIRAAPGMRGS